MWRQLRNQLVSILDANALIADVYDYEAEEFKGRSSSIGYTLRE